MLEKTKTALKEELAKSLICTDPAPMPGEGIVNIAKSLKEDMKEMLNKQSTEVETNGN